MNPTNMSRFALIAAAFALCNSFVSVAAVNMTHYAPSSDVPAEFKAYLQELYFQAEDPTSTSAFTDFFTENGSLNVTGDYAAGAGPILALKQALLPTDGSKVWNHFPQVTTVHENTSGAITLQVDGTITTTFPTTYGNCSQAVYQSYFIVAKTDGVAEYTAQIGNLVSYDDFVVEPGYTPTEFPCTV